MFVTKLTIKKRESYEPNPNTLVGSVVLEGPTGKQEIILSSAAISRIFGVIGEEIIDRSRNNAKMTKNAVDEAIHEPLLADASKVSDEEIPS
jgi:hypothetical protein